MKGWVAGCVACLTRRYPLCSGCGRIGNSPLLRRLTPGGAAGEPVRAPIRGGGRMWVDAGDYVGRAIYFVGELDPKVTWAIRRVLRPGDTFIDVGANQGLVSLLAARIVGAGRAGAGGRVHAIEPQAHLAALLRRSAAEWPSRAGGGAGAPVTVHEVGLSDRDGVARLAVPEGNGGAASLEPENASLGPAVEIPLVRGDAYFARLGLGPVRAMKVDVEGHEGRVFDGLSGWLASRGAPELIVFESANDRPLRERHACRTLTALGYQLADLPPALVRARARWVGADGAVRGHDLLAVRPGTGAAARLGLRERARERVVLSGPAVAAGAGVGAEA